MLPLPACGLAQGEEEEEDEPGGPQRAPEFRGSSATRITLRLFTGLGIDVPISFLNITHLGIWIPTDLCCVDVSQIAKGHQSQAPDLT